MSRAEWAGEAIWMRKLMDLRDPGKKATDWRELNSKSSKLINQERLLKVSDLT